MLWALYVKSIAPMITSPLQSLYFEFLVKELLKLVPKYPLSPILKRSEERRVGKEC